MLLWFPAEAGSDREVTKTIKLKLAHEVHGCTVRVAFLRLEYSQDAAVFRGARYRPTDSKETPSAGSAKTNMDI